MDPLDQLQSLGSLITSRGAKLLEGIKSGAELLSFRPHVLTVGSLRLITTSLIAEGGYSFVYTAREMAPSGSEQGRIFALKKVIAQEEETVEIGRAEMRLLSTLPPHPHIIRYYGGSIEHKGRGVSEMYMVLEYCPNGSLVDLVMPGQPQLPEAKLLSIFHSVCKAVAHLHSQSPPIAHRDLKLENVLCNASGLYKLCDFGSVTTRRVKPDSRAERLREEEIISKFSTLMYRAPEMVDLYQGREIFEAVDVWSLGCILYTLAFHKHPFDAGTELQIVNACVSFPATSPYDAAIHDLILFALEPDPAKRPTIFELIGRVSARRAHTLDDEISLADSYQQLEIRGAGPRERASSHLAASSCTHGATLLLSVYATAAWCLSAAA
jgi:AP2-associated kinase